MKKVLVLDDDVDLCSVLTQMFLLLGALECICAHSLYELQDLKKVALVCDVALLDVNLGANTPNGIDAYEWMKSNQYEGRVVFFSGHARSHPLVQKALRVSDVKFLEKPASIDDLEGLLK